MSFPGFPAPPSPGPPPSPSTHNLLSSTHGDTVPSGATAGGLVRGNASGNWEQLPLGAQSFVLTSFGGQAVWQAAQSGVSSNIFTVGSGSTTNFGVQNSVFFNGVQSGVNTVFMPSNPVLGQTHIIKDIDGVAQANNVTISGSGNNIDGQAITTLTNDYQAVQLLFGPKFEWNIV